MATDPEPCPACHDALVRVPTATGAIHFCPVCCADGPLIVGDDSPGSSPPPASRAPLVASLADENRRLRQRLAARPAVTAAARRVIARARELTADYPENPQCGCALCTLTRTMRRYDEATSR